MNNVLDTYYSPITLSLARARGPQVLHARFSVDGWACFSAQSLPCRGVIDEMSARSFFSVISRYRHFVFVTATAENPISHKYVSAKGSNSFVW